MTVSEYLRLYYTKNPTLPIEVWIEHCMKDFAEEKAILFCIELHLSKWEYYDNDPVLGVCYKNTSTGNLRTISELYDLIMKGERNEKKN